MTKVWNWQGKDLSKFQNWKKKEENIYFPHLQKKIWNYFKKHKINILFSFFLFPFFFLEAWAKRSQDLKRILEQKKGEINGCTMMMSMVIHCIFKKNIILFNFPNFDLMQNFGKKTHFTTIKPFIFKNII